MSDDDDEYHIERSPLSQTISKDGITVQILIYRGESDNGWLLEVVDDEDASTVWEDTFDTDEAALAEAMDTIAKEGIATFLRDPSKPLH